MNSKFKFEEQNLKNVYLISVFNLEDERGCFTKDYNEGIFKNNNVDFSPKETFYTTSKRGVIRAIHFQEIVQQAKLVRCIKGKIYDVIVDLRKESPTYGKWEGFILSEENMNELYIPKSLGHGYLVIEDSIVSYKCSEMFFPEGDSGIVWNDNELNIEWPLELVGGIDEVILSKKDMDLMSFNEYRKGKSE